MFVFFVETIYIYGSSRYFTQSIPYYYDVFYNSILCG